MNRDEFTHKLPPLSNNPLPIKPPFVFNGMSARIFPLRANLDTLQQVCDGYLNFIPREAGYFRASAPYVLLMLLDYGQVTESVTRIGWFSQTEVFFSVPVEWYKLVNGQWVFHDWAVITPYIFVNDSFSVPLGRSVYGFTKVLASVTKVDSRWIEDPVAPATLARVETMVFPEAYAGGQLENSVFLEVERAAPMSNLRVPFDPGSPMAPWVIASNLADAIGGFGRDAMWLAQAMRIFPVNPAASPALMQEMLVRMAPAFAPGGTGFIQNSINLKQFRRSEDPDRICYQSVTNGCMMTTAFNGGGLLGEDRVLLGDLSGGHTIKLYDHSSLPIARTLGLEIHRTSGCSDVDVMELKPVMPFWIDVNLKYDQGTNIAWRTDDGIWRDQSGAAFDPAQKPAGNHDETPEFNSTVASAIEAIAGPFQFWGTTVRVLPLLARKKQLQSFLDNYINEPLGSPVLREDGKRRERVRFSVWARPKARINPGLPIGGETAYVYLTASSFSGVTSDTNNVGDWAKYELSFMIPVKWERWEADGTQNGVWKTTGVGLVPAYSMVDDCIAAISRLEVQGIDARTADFVRPESVWLGQDEDGSGAEPKQTLLRVDAEVWPAYGAGQKATMQPVVEISRGDSDAGFSDAVSRDVPFEWAELLRRELGTKKGIKEEFPSQMKVARALALELLGNQTPFAIYTLKQVRDVTDPDKACYQSIVRVSRSLHEVFDVREIEETLVVRIHDYPGLDIVETLGIVASRLPDCASGIVYSTQAVRPFYIRATVDEPLGERLLRRSGTTQWTLYEKAFHTLLSDQEGSPRIVADRKAEKLQDQIDPCRMSAIMYEARQRQKNEGAQAISKEHARDAVGTVDPQSVIESVLSREWGNFDYDARWRRGRRDLLKALTALPLGGQTKAFAESVLYRELNNLMAGRPGAVASLLPADQMPSAPPPDRRTASERWEALWEQEEKLANPAPDPRTDAERWQEQMETIFARQYTFTDLRLRMERDVNVLASLGILGLEGMRTALHALGQGSPSDEMLANSGADLIESFERIQNLEIAGEPSERNNLDTSVLACQTRLGELIATLKAELQTTEMNAAKLKLQFGSAHVDEFRQAVELARNYCGAQHEALLNKLSRAYQKPDFCIRRQSVGVDRDNLLPPTLSWNDDWYYGDQIRLSAQPAPPVKRNRVAKRVLKRAAGGAHG